MASAAEPIMASSLWAAELATNRDGKGRHLHLGTGLRELDTALNGGLEYGSTGCITAEIGSYAQDVVLGLITNQLLSDKTASVTVIHSTLSFDVRRLHTHFTTACATRLTAPEVASEALAMLDRVRIMKVFDFIGLTESVAELRDDLESDGLDPTAIARSQQQPRTINAPADTIQDSQDEDEDEMLDDGPLPVDQPPAVTTQTIHQPKDRHQGNNTSHLLIIDNISHLASPLLKNNHTQGQALLASFMRALSHLTKAYGLCTVLLNNAITYGRPSREEAPSVFSSCALQPALGKTFTYFLDLHLLAHRVPKSAADARAVFGEQQQVAKEAEMVTVVEVLQDRLAGRVGRWAVVDGGGGAGGG